MREEKQVAIALIIIVLLAFILSEVKSCHEEKNSNVTSEEYVIPYDDDF